MRQRTLGSQGPAVSEQGLGCMGMTFAYGPADEQEALRTAHRALELGVTLLDTADFYGPHSNEEFVARVIAGRRDGVVVCSKVGNEVTEDGTITGRLNNRPDYIRTAVEGTLRRLGTDHLDLYYLHRVDPAVPVEESVGALAELVQAGKVRHLGVCEASAATIRRAHAVHPLAAVQTEYSLSTRDVEANGVLATVRELGIGFVGYSPLGRGLLTGRIRSLDGLAEHDFRRIAPRFQQGNLDQNLHVVERLQHLAASKGITAGQLALAWVLAQGDDVIAIPGTKRVPYLQENLAASDVTLSADDLRALDEIAPHGSTVGDRYPVGAMATLDG
ncbi:MULTISPECIES: aldo/keto reductase [unclassified Streptomyces]|uniref:aldo/keto reductase n=1 Tax=unclassified Streptomyces TaxID=2593676 RepID=UPI0011CDA49A|nr:MULTISPECIES: aldo/keto reductase [unclassified Streptomyces]TXS54758.1 aldo/keto reductase [Streptomyces sp. me109]